MRKKICRVGRQMATNLHVEPVEKYAQKIFKKNAQKTFCEKNCTENLCKKKLQKILAGKLDEKNCLKTSTQKTLPNIDLISHIF